MASEDEEFDCPLCMEEMDISDRNFKPCPCGYQICRFCWNHIRQDLNGKCPACRREYSEQIVEFTPVTPAEIQRFKNEKRQKDREKKEMEANNRRHLANMRVVQKNLVYIIGLNTRLATEELLRQHDYFGQYGKIMKIVINKRNLGTYNQVQQQQQIQASKNELTVGVYVTYQRKEDAAKCIVAVDGTVHEGRVLRASYGTTKYCSFYLRGLQCQNPGCMYLHEPGEEADSFTKEEMTLGKHHGKSPYGNAPGSPLVGESGAVGPAAPFGINAQFNVGDDTATSAAAVTSGNPVQNDKKMHRVGSGGFATEGGSDEWPAPSSASVAVDSPGVLPRSSAWASRAASLSVADHNQQQQSSMKLDDSIHCDIFHQIYPETTGKPPAPVHPTINTWQFHRYLILSKQAREYFLQLTQAAFAQVPPGSAPNTSSLFIFNPFKSNVEQEQSRFGFAKQYSSNNDNVSELAERFNRIDASGMAADDVDGRPALAGLGMNITSK